MHCSVRTIAAESAISPRSVHCYFKLLGPPENALAPENALVLCGDETSQCQALERMQPMLPMDFGYVEGVTHDYVRHRTSTLFAALNILNGAVLVTCNPRHRHQELPSFLCETASHICEPCNPG